MLARLPLWLRVAVPLVALATLYHYWLPLSTAFTRDLLRLGGGSQLVSSLSFFIHEVPEVMMLLVGIVFAVGVVRTFFSPERTRSLLRGRRKFTGNAMAASLAVYVPGGATTRSLRALEPSLILTVLCKGAHEDTPAARA